MKNIKTLTLIICSALLVFTFKLKAQQTNDFEVNFEITGKELVSAFCILGNTDHFVMPEEIKVTDGKFKIVGNLNEPTVAQVTFRAKGKNPFAKQSADGGFYPVKSANLHIILYPGAKFNVKEDLTSKDFVSIYPTDGGENDILAKLNKVVMPLYNEDVNIKIAIEQDKNLTEAQKEQKIKRSKEIASELAKYKLNFVAKNYNSIAGIWLMNDMLTRREITMDEVKKSFIKINSKYHNYREYKKIEAHVKGATLAKIGMQAPIISTKKDHNGQQFSLAQLKGKYVLLDFWGTWCGPCLDEVPKLKQLQITYAEKLKILGVAQDTDVELWKATIKEHAMNWDHVINNDRNVVDYIAMYNVRGFPTKVLVSPEGKIILSSFENPNFDKELKALLN